jgi:hypothetical protein
MAVVLCLTGLHRTKAVLKLSARLNQASEGPPVTTCKIENYAINQMNHYQQHLPCPHYSCLADEE